MQAGRISKLDKLAKEYVEGGKPSEILEKIEKAAKEAKEEYVESRKGAWDDAWLGIDGCTSCT